MALEEVVSTSQKRKKSEINTSIVSAFRIWTHHGEVFDLASLWWEVSCLCAMVPTHGLESWAE